MPTVVEAFFVMFFVTSAVFYAGRKKAAGVFMATNLRVWNMKYIRVV